ncbi:hypothetical protein BDQ17DRAFT_1235096, partial [Cyathus striatus]
MVDHITSTDNIEDIKNSLEVTTKHIHGIDSKIEQLQQQVHELQVKRSKAYDIIIRQRALIAPILKLGHDILQEIFIACLPADRNPCMSIVEAPMLLTRVCSTWRSIAHSTPRLWAAIHIVLPDVSLEPMITDIECERRMDFIRLKLDQRRAAAKEWLDRSGACPLSLSV